MALGRGGDIGRIRIRLGVDGADLDRDIDAEVNRAAGRSEGTFGKWGKRAAGAFAAVFAADVGRRAFDATVGSFAGFETRMNEVFTLLPDISDQAMQDMTGQVKDFAKEFGVLPDKVIPALYQSLSAGVPPDNVFAFLETAQKAAKGGVAELETAVDGISSVVNAYGVDVLSAAQASDFMFTAVRMGKTTFDELSRSLFNVTPTAAALGVSFGDVTASLASLTAQGVPTSVATTQLRQLFVEMSKEGSAAVGVFEKLAGKSFKDFVASGGNVQQALQLLERHAQTTGVGVNDLFGSVEAGSAALALTGKGTETLTRNLEAMGSSAGATDAAFDRMNKGIGPVFDRMRARASVALLDVGQKVVQLGSALKSAFSGGGVTSDGLVGTFERIGVAARQLFDKLQPAFGFIRENAQPILIGLGVAITAVVVPALVSMAVSGLAAIAPLLLIAAAVAGAIIAFKRFEGVREVVRDVAEAVSEHWSNLVAWTRGKWGQVSEAVGHAVSVITRAWREWGDEILNVARIAWDQVRNIVETAIGLVRGVITTVLALINGDWGKAWDGVKDILATAWNFIFETLRNQLRLAREVVEAGLGAVRGVFEIAWHLIQGVVREGVAFIVDKFLAMAEWTLKAAEKAFGWIPGIGPKLRDASDKFEQFRNDVNASIRGIQDEKEIVVYATGVEQVISDFRRIQAELGRTPGFGTVTPGSIPEYQLGGWVDAPLGKRQLAFLHGGEFVVPADIAKHIRRTGSFQPPTMPLDALAAGESLRRAPPPPPPGGGGARARGRSTTTGWSGRWSGL